MNRWLASGAAFLLVGFALWLGITRYGQARYAEGRASLASQVAAASAEAERSAAQEFEIGFARGQEASLGFIQWREGPARTVREEITRETVRYAQSPAGSAACFDADGLRAVNQGIATITGITFSAAPGPGDPALPRPFVDPAIIRWHGEPGSGARSDAGNGAGPGGVRNGPPAAAQGLANRSAAAR